MNDSQLKRCIQSVGKSCFVLYFEQFANPHISNEDLIDRLVRDEQYMESGARTRVFQSRRIIRAGRAIDVLRSIASSERVPQVVRERARDMTNAF